MKILKKIRIGLFLMSSIVSKKRECYRKGWMEMEENVYKTCKDDCLLEIGNYSSSPGFGP